jgi:hypothetical protein
MQFPQLREFSKMLNGYNNPYTEPVPSAKLILTAPGWGVAVAKAGL